MKKIVLSALITLFSATYGFSQVTPAPSPAATAMQVVGVTKISIDYSRPALRGREIFGKLIPFGKVYRTGANGSTKFENSSDITVEGQPLPAGKYAIMSIPEAGEWTVIFSKNLGVNEGNYKESEDALRVKVKSSEVALTESFTIDFTDLKDDAGKMNIYWEKTKVSLNIGVNVEKAIDNAITQQSNQTSGTFQQAADYMVQKGMDLNKALGLIDKSISLRETFRNNWIKSQILGKLGKNSDALAFAMKAQSLGGSDPSYQFFKDAIEKGITEIKGKLPVEVPTAVPATVPTKKKKG
jgi:hypothetical protein